MVLLNTIETLIKLCQIFGLAPFSRCKKGVKWKLDRKNSTISIVFLMVTALNLLFCLIFNKRLIDHNDAGLDVIIFTYSIVIICVHAVVIVAENFYKRNQHVKILNLFLKLELMEEYQGIQLDSMGTRRFLHRSILLWVLGTFGLSGLYILVLVITRNVHDLYYFLVCALPSLLSKLSYIYSMVLVNMLGKNVNALTMFTRSLIIDSQKCFEVLGRKYRRSRGYEINLRKIEFLKKCQILIWNISTLFNHTHFWSLSIGFLNEFSVLIFNCFFFIQLFQKPPEAGLYSILYIISWTSMNLFNIIYITSTCGNADKAVSLQILELDELLSY